jgi:hypothetical protein
MLHMLAIAERMAKEGRPPGASPDSACAAVAFRQACKLGDGASCPTAEGMEKGGALGSELRR